MTVTDPLNQQEVHSYDLTNPQLENLETEVVYKDSAGSALRTVTYGYSYETHCMGVFFPALYIHPLRAGSNVTLDNGMTAGASLKYDEYGNVTEKDEYDWSAASNCFDPIGNCGGIPPGNPPPANKGPLLRITTFDYLYNIDSRLYSGPRKLDQAIS